MYLTDIVMLNILSLLSGQAINQMFLIKRSSLCEQKDSAQGYLQKNPKLFQTFKSAHSAFSEFVALSWVEGRNFIGDQTKAHQTGVTTANENNDSKAFVSLASCWIKKTSTQETMIRGNPRWLTVFTPDSLSLLITPSWIKYSSENLTPGDNLLLLRWYHVWSSRGSYLHSYIMKPLSRFVCLGVQ